MWPPLIVAIFAGLWVALVSYSQAAGTPINFTLWLGVAFATAATGVAATVYASKKAE